MSGHCITPDTTWALGSTNPHKVIHRPTCPSARHAYGFLQGMTSEQVVEALTERPTFALRWHAVCGRCCKDLNALIVKYHNEARR